MWQIIPYVLHAKDDPTSEDACTEHPETPSLRCLARGAILALARFIQNDPFQSDGQQTGAYFNIYKGANVVLPDCPGESEQPASQSMLVCRGSCFMATDLAWPRSVFQVLEEGFTLDGYNAGLGGSQPVAEDVWLLEQGNGVYKAPNSAEGEPVPPTAIGNEIQGISYIENQWYEPDGSASWVRAALLYDQEYPDENFLAHPWIVRAMELFVQTAKTEVDHDSSPYLELGLGNGGKGKSVNTFDFERDDAVLTWVGYRPSDAPCQEHYLIPTNLYMATALDSLANRYAAAGMNASWITDAQTLAAKIAAGVERYGTAFVPLNGETVEVYAYEVNGYPPGDTQRNALVMDDANYPSLLTLPLMVDPKFYEVEIYKNTVEYIKTYNDGYPPFYFSSDRANCDPEPSIRYAGLGSYTGDDKIWPMALVMDSWMMTLVDGDFDEDAFWSNIQQLWGFLNSQSFSPLSFPESFNVCDPADDPTRSDDTFGWMAATYVLMARGWLDPFVRPYPLQP